MLRGAVMNRPTFDFCKRLGWLIALTFTGFHSIPFAAPTAIQQQPDLVTLTVSSSCASVSVRLSTGEVLKTPFNKLLPRGQQVTIEALDSTAPNCDTFQDASDFQRFVINQDLQPKRQSTAQITLGKDTSVFINYGASDRPVVTLSGLTTCGRSVFRLIEGVPANQEGQLTTHFDLTLYQGQRIKLEAFPQLACGDTGSVFGFHHWVVGGKSYPEGKITVEFSVEQYTTAVPIYDSFIEPRTPLNSFQLLRNGSPVDFIRQGDKLKRYTVILNADHFPHATKVFADGVETEIVASSTNQLEVKFPGKKAKKSGIISIVAVAPLTPVNQYFAPVPIEVRKE
jgi:hypothetical protein